MKALLTVVLFALLAGHFLQAAPESTPRASAPFRIIFKAYDGDPNKDRVEKFSFQIDTLDLRQPSEFLKLGDTIPNTPLKLIGFKYKTRLNEKTGEQEDVSELMVVNVRNSKQGALIYGQAFDAMELVAPAGGN